MLLIIGLSTDVTTLHTCRAAGNQGVPFHFMDLRRYADRGHLDWDPMTGEGEIGIRGGIIHEFPSREIDGIYARIIDLSFRREAQQRNEASARIMGLTEVLRTVRCKVVNRPGSDDGNASKLLHLEVLRQCGFEGPDSLCTNVPEAAENWSARFDSQSVLFKGASSAKTFAELINPETNERLMFLRRCPALFQERVGDFDVRTHMIGEECFSERIVSDAVDYRLSSQELTYDSLSLPARICESCQKYRELSGLDFIGFDFRVSRDASRWHVLEANPMPGYDAYDRRSGFEISRSLFFFLSGRTGPQGLSGETDADCSRRAAARGKAPSEKE